MPCRIERVNPDNPINKEMWLTEILSAHLKKQIYTNRQWRQTTRRNGRK
jgi:hypothetical protein